MKKIFYYIFAATLSFGMASCTKNDVVVPEETLQMTIHATLGDDNTKTTITGDDQSGYKNLWSEGDQIKIYHNGQYHNYTLASGAGTRMGTFTGTQLPNGDYIATYGAGFSYTQTSGNLANEQNYNMFSDASWVPMTATVHVSSSETTITAFKNATGYLRLDLDGIGTVKSIKVTTDQNIAGAITLENGVAKVAQSGSGVYKYVSLNCADEGIDLGSKAKSFYISLPQGAYTGLSIEIKDTYGFVRTKTLKAGKQLNITRSKINPVSLSVIFPAGKSKTNINGRQVDVRWVQLWENGPKWAEYNLGVTDGKPESYGERNVVYPNDPTPGQWGDNWQTPSYEDLQGLTGKCNHEFILRNGVKCVKVYGKNDYTVCNIVLPIDEFYDTNNSIYASREAYKGLTNVNIHSLCISYGLHRFDTRNYYVIPLANGSYYVRPVIKE